MEGEEMVRDALPTKGDEQMRRDFGALDTPYAIVE